MLAIELTNIDAIPAPAMIPPVRAARPRPAASAAIVTIVATSDPANEIISQM